MPVPVSDPGARTALIEASELAGLPTAVVELVRVGSNSVYRIDSDFIGRVAPDLTFRANAERQVRVARWLERIGFPATRALPVEQPIEASGRVVTLWGSVCRNDVYAPIGDVARLIRELHTLDVPSDIDLPALRPFGAPGDQLPALSDLSAVNRAFLQERIGWAREAFPLLPFVLPRGVIHGDANVGNVLLGDDGQAVLIDLDGFAVGPREWDLIQTAPFHDRLGWHTHEEYRTFVEVYGYDLTTWEGYSALADMREFAMTTWLGRKAGESVAMSKEAEKRITAIRTGASRRDWGAY